MRRSVSWADHSFTYIPFSPSEALRSGSHMVLCCTGRQSPQLKYWLRIFPLHLRLLHSHPVTMPAHIHAYGSGDRHPLAPDKQASPSSPSSLRRPSAYPTGSTAISCHDQMHPCIRSSPAHRPALASPATRRSQTCRICLSIAPS